MGSLAVSGSKKALWGICINLVPFLLLQLNTADRLIYKEKRFVQLVALEGRRPSGGVTSEEGFLLVHTLVESQGGAGHHRVAFKRQLTSFLYQSLSQHNQLGQ